VNIGVFVDRRLTGALFFVCLCLALAVSATRAQSPAADIPKRVDAILSKTFRAAAPGAAVIVVKDGEVLFRKGYGLANLETQTAMRPEMVFELGSVTKQFTSTAILMLAEQGKLSLADNIKKYFPEYPNKGATITVENLLTHTSGIKSYTDEQSWLEKWRQDMTPQQIIALTEAAALEFPPGSRWHYNNTGYTMLGVIIEKVSGLSYADFIHQNIFEPLGMSHSLYGSFTAVIPNRAAGYTQGRTGWENAPYLSMTQPYSAGSLMSNVDDLARWDAAVSEGKLVSKGSWDRAMTGFKLANGEDTHYGYGWELSEYEGHRIVHHGGGIPGYLSEALRIPQDHTYVAILANSDDVPVDLDFLATIIAGEVIGKPYTEPTPIELPTTLLDTYVGVYQIDENATRTITREGNRLFMQRTRAPKFELFALAEEQFFRKSSFQRISFQKDASGKIIGLVSRTFGLPDEPARRTDKPISR
jgi:D-alanyl-D-alanine carboxypeptidase